MLINNDKHRQWLTLIRHIDAALHICIYTFCPKRDTNVQIQPIRTPDLHPYDEAGAILSLFLLSDQNQQCFSQ